MFEPRVGVGDTLLDVLRVADPLGLRKNCAHASGGVRESLIDGGERVGTYTSTQAARWV